MHPISQPFQDVDLSAVFRDVALTRDGLLSTPPVADPRRGDLLAPVH